LAGAFRFPPAEIRPQGVADRVVRVEAVLGALDERLGPQPVEQFGCSFTEYVPQQRLLKEVILSLNWAEMAAEDPPDGMLTMHPR
jgi:hypothetical protein